MHKQILIRLDVFIIYVMDAMLDAVDVQYGRNLIVF